MQYAGFAYQDSEYVGVATELRRARSAYFKRMREAQTSEEIDVIEETVGQEYAHLLSTLRAIEYRLTHE
jgi:hypothetical protein